ncbi:MAG: hypothetical protein IJ121_00935 [Eubacterium sp.]|nr:hypothetical protein [Eubacterium sp.]
MLKKNRQTGKLKIAARVSVFFIWFILGVLIVGNTAVLAAEGYDKAAAKQGKFEADKVTVYGMTPVDGNCVADGTYPVEVRSSSKYFRITSAELQVSGGAMQLAVEMDSTAYEYVYPGMGIAAAKAEQSDFIALEKTDTGTAFTLEVPALNQAFPCAAFSKKKKKWYDRALLVDASSLPEEALSVNVPDYDLLEEALDAYAADPEHADQVKDARETFYAAEAAAQGVGTDTAGKNKSAVSASSGTTGSGNSQSNSGGAGNTGEAAETTASSAAGSTDTEDSLIEMMDAETMRAIPEAVPLDLADGTYAIEVTMTGGSGRASISSPTWLIVQDGKAFAKLLWSSTYYDYMIVNGRKYLNQTTDGGNSTFIIPVTALDEPMEVVADTTAMGDPVAIDYVLTFYEDTIGSKSQIPQEAAKKVLISALIIMAAGGIVNYFVKRRRTGA